MTRALVTTAVAALLFALSADAQDEIVEQAKRLVVMVDSTLLGQQQSGAGIVLGYDEIEEEYIVVTARHLLWAGDTSSSAVTVRFYDARDHPLQATIALPSDPDRDVAFLHVASGGPDPSSLPWNRLGRTSGLRLGDQLYVVGQHGHTPWQYNAQADSFLEFDSDARETFRFDSALVSHGASGGAVFESRWYIVGMVLGGDASAPRAEAVSMDWLGGFADANDVAVDLGRRRIRSAPNSVTPEESTQSGDTRLEVGRKVSGEVRENAIEPIRYEVRAPFHARLIVSVHNKAPAGSARTGLGPVRVFDVARRELGIISQRYLGSGSAEAHSAPISVHADQVYGVEIEPQSATARVPFTIATQFAGIEVEDYYEPNDIARDAADVRVGETVEAIVGYAGDRDDWYRLTPRVSGTVLIQAQNGSPSRTTHANLGELQVFREHGMTPRPGISSRYLAPGGKAASTAPLAVEGGLAYLIRVATLDATHATPYIITSSVTGYADDDLGEPNDEFESAHELPPTGRWDGLIGLGQDVRDCYRIVATRSGTMVIEVQNRNPKSAARGNLGMLRISDSANNEITRLTSRYLAPGSSPTPLKVSVQKDAAYYIVVEAGGDQHIAPYTLNLSLL